MKKKKILYIDMDNVLVDFQSGIDQLDEETKMNFDGDLGESAYKRLILSHHKDLNAGDFLVDDRDKNGAAEFCGEFLQFGKGQFPDWKSVKEYLLKNQ